MSGIDRPVVAITLGDPNGIGPEIVLKALQSDALLQHARYIVVGSASVLDACSQSIGKSLSSEVAVEEAGAFGDRVAAGEVSGDAGRLAMLSVRRACELCLAGEAAAMVTAPISKEAIHLGGYEFPGHTEFLAQLTDAKHVVMMLVSADLRVALLTIHEPIANVARLITSARLRTTLQTLSRTLQSDFGIDSPHIAVLGLNPHAGEGGVIGMEEIDVILPAVEVANSKGLNVAGPFPADSFFGRPNYLHFDAVLAMYHDQGLAPFKALAMGAGVNVTCGLPIVRTSPDHGTAFNIAGKNMASADSMKEAILLAVNIAQRRKVAMDEKQAGH